MMLTFESYYRRSGFTLMELMIVVIVVGVLAALIIPRYGIMARKARADEARTNLRLILTGEKMYRLGYNTYATVDTTTFFPLAPTYIDNPNAYPDRSFDYSITFASTSTLTARATYKKDTSNYITIDETGAIDDSHF